MIKSFDYQRAKELMKENGVSQSDIMFYLAENGVNYTLDGVKNWFRKDEATRKTPEINTIALLAKFFKVGLDELIIGATPSNIVPLKPVPIVGSARCGIPDSNALQETDKFTYCNADDWNEDVYAVIANGDSMSPKIEDGDEVTCDPRADILDGDVVHYQLDGDSAIKVYLFDKKAKKIKFIPYNSDFEVKEFSKDDEAIASLRMVKVINVSKSLKNDRKARLKALGY